MLDVPGRLPHFHCARQRPAAHKHAHRQHTPRGEGTQLGRWAVGGGRHAPVFKPWRSSRCGPSEFESIGSMRTSSHQPTARRRQAGHIRWASAARSQNRCAGGAPGGTGEDGVGRVRGRCVRLTSWSRQSHGWSVTDGLAARRARKPIFLGNPYFFPYFRSVSSQK